MRIFAMVTTAKSRAYTRPALESFFRNTPLNDEDCFYLIDNDGRFTERSSLPSSKIEVVVNSSPLGFAANVNQMLALAEKPQADLFFLNNDVIFTSNWLQPLLIDSKALLSPLCNREVQYSLAVVVHKTQDTSKLYSLPMVTTLDEFTGNEYALEAIAEAHQQRNQGYWAVYHLPFFCIKIPNAVHSTLGRFDESFGRGGGEDYDYCLRARLAGFSVEYALQSYLLHFGGKSTYSGAESESAQLEREKLFFARFKEKWGERLHDVLLKEQSERIYEIPENRELEKSGRLNEVIRNLAGERNNPIKI